MSSKSGNLVPWPFLFVWSADEIGKGIENEVYFERPWERGWVKSGGVRGEGGGYDLIMTVCFQGLISQVRGRRDMGPNLRTKV